MRSDFSAPLCLMVAWAIYRCHAPQCTVGAVSDRPPPSPAVLSREPICRSVLILKEGGTLRLAGSVAGAFVIVEMLVFQHLVKLIPQASPSSLNATHSTPY